MADVSLNLVVIRSLDIDRAAQFYRLLGLPLEKHRHGAGPLHYAAELGAVVFEIYPGKSEADAATSVRLGFQVVSLDAVVAALQQVGARIASAPQETEWGRKAVVDDPDGRRIELNEAATA